MVGGVSFTESEETDTNLYGPSSATNPHANQQHPRSSVAAASPKSFLSSFGSSHDHHGPFSFGLGARRDMGNSGNSHESSTFGSYEQPSQSQQQPQPQPLPPVPPQSTNHTTPNNNSTTATTSPRNGGG
eukprot:scaffold198143_cov67-Attheya_sp.AAC.1